MIREIQIENFKSIKKMKLELGRVNVFIGENGSGKSNILEAIALAGAAAGDRLDNEFLFSRGVRPSEPRHMRCALNSEAPSSDIVVSLSSQDKTRVNFVLTHDGRPYSSWKCKSSGEASVILKTSRMLAILEMMLAERETNAPIDSNLAPLSKLIETDRLASAIAELRELERTTEEDDDTELVLKTDKFSSLKSDKSKGVKDLMEFVIFSPENQSLRTFEREGQIEPLGIRGEGLLKFLQVLDSTPSYEDAFLSIRKRLKILGWFDDLFVPASERNSTSKIEIKDRYLSESAGRLDQFSANEGFLFLLFYFCLFSTDLTPRFFAVDNVDASLNPKLCAHLVTELASLAGANDKQAILTTHNPATLDGLDLNDDEQRLFVISRGDEGETKIRRIKQKEGSASDVKLSTAFINGYLGGLPKNF
ncbi:AAA family ATPase [Stenotrophomonas sp.]|uniref:AAA family ATPase n=1 Tax=Stenotrophomonas sp. TaxID=69392 RepID=UPI0028AC354C|nr:AAA family ATPase [Stenotrophomonas sp.]